MSSLGQSLGFAGWTSNSSTASIPPNTSGFWADDHGPGNFMREYAAAFPEDKTPQILDRELQELRSLVSTLVIKVEALQKEIEDLKKDDPLSLLKKQVNDFRLI